MIGAPFSVQASFTRPANTTQYSVKDVVGNSVARSMIFKKIIPLSDVAYWIMSPFLISSNPAATSGSFKLLLFRAPPTTPVDHAVFAPTLPELGYFVGCITFDTAIKISTGTIYVQDGFKPLWGLALPEGQDIYGVLLDDSGYTPASEESFRVVLDGYWEVQQDR